jgi:hypothetical protein
MDDQQLQDLHDSLMPLFPEDSQTRRALSLSQQILTATLKEDAAQALLELLRLLATANSLLPNLIGQLWAMASTSDGIETILTLARKLRLVEQDRSE